MTDHTPAKLMPKWWQRASAAVLYAAYALWLVPLGMYFLGGADALTAFAWLIGMVVAQFILVKLIALIEFLTTANEIERLRAAEDGLAQTGDKN
jgi:hypothetical protein